MKNGPPNRPYRTVAGTHTTASFSSPLIHHCSPKPMSHHARRQTPIVKPLTMQHPVQIRKPRRNQRHHQHIKQPDLDDGQPRENWVFPIVLRNNQPPPPSQRCPIPSPGTLNNLSQGKISGLPSEPYHRDSYLNYPPPSPPRHLRQPDPHDFDYYDWPQLTDSKPKTSNLKLSENSTTTSLTTSPSTTSARTKSTPTSDIQTTNYTTANSTMATIRTSTTTSPMTCQPTTTSTTSPSTPNLPTKSTPSADFQTTISTMTNLTLTTTPINPKTIPSTTSILTPNSTTTFPMNCPPTTTSTTSPSTPTLPTKSTPSADFQTTISTMTNLTLITSLIDPKTISSTTSILTPTSTPSVVEYTKRQLWHPSVKILNFREWIPPNGTPPDFLWFPLVIQNHTALLSYTLWLFLHSTQWIPPKVFLC